ncbi:MAG: M1 family metallopeptidase [Bacteroidetes bacterium]|nr:M1 family metallopeptidase [Bacteroidota bacterium]
MKKYFLFLLLVQIITTILAQDKTVTYYVDPSANPPDLMVTLKHLDARVSFVSEQNLVIGSTEFTFSPNRYKTDSIVFYAPDFTIQSVNLDGQKINWKIQSPSLILYPQAGLLIRNREYKIAIEYQAKPMAGAIYFTGWRSEEQGKRKEIWAHRPHGWLPYIDARITVDMFITFDSDYKVFSNGERIDVSENMDKTKTWHYRMAKNHPFFSTALVIGNYDFQVSHSGGGVPLELWYYRGQEDRVKPTYQYTEAMMDFLEKETGVKYPYPLYRQAPVIDYMYGAMETTTSTIFGDFILIDPHAYWQRNYINTNAHEMAHQWFGNAISHLQNKDVWLTESFATFYAKMFDKSVFGEDYFENDKNDELMLALTAAKNNNYPVGGSLGGNARIYQKGSLVLGMLNYVMGDTEFKDAIKYYLEHHLFTNAETSDFIRAVYEVTCKPYQWFFEEWVLHGGEPDYKVTYAVSDDTTGLRSTHIRVWQMQPVNEQVGLYKMPINFEVHYKDGSMEVKQVWIENKQEEVILPNQQKKSIDFVLFDPGRQIVKKMTFEKSFEELSNQAMKADHMIDRFDALVGIRSIPVSVKRDILIRCYNKEKFFLTRAEIIDQLAADTVDKTFNLFHSALTDEDALVRKAVLKSLAPVPPVLKGEFVRALKDYSYLNIELALDNLCQSFPEETETYLGLTKNEKGWRGLNIRMKWLEIAIGKGHKEFLQELIGYTTPEFEFETRINAFKVLKKLRYIDETVVKNANQAAKHWNGKLSAAAKEYLGYFGN